jgi:molybdopterin/thiamine biosynthesis adenylyltransferase
MEQHTIEALTTLSQTDVFVTPQVFDMDVTEDVRALESLLHAGCVRVVHDVYVEQLEELFFVHNPQLVFHPEGKQRFEQQVADLKTKKPLALQGVWVYFPWDASLTHLLKEADFVSVRTARNTYLITPQEAAMYQQATVAIAGMSIGSSIALALGMQGVGGSLRLADMDTLALSNTNRILAGVTELGLPKVVMVARRLWEINPYLRIEIFQEGLTEKNITTFFKGAQVIIDEVDSLAAKVRIREEAKKQKIPVVMAADCGESSILDVERYDHEPQPAFFHNRLGDLTVEQVRQLHKKDIGRLIATHVGIENHNERMLYSLTEMGKSVVSWPQLGSTALLNAAAVAFCVRHVLSGAPLFDNRTVISFEQLLEPKKEESAAHSRAEIEAKFRAMFDIL